jgi:hypothetical protein
MCNLKPLRLLGPVAFISFMFVSICTVEAQSGRVFERTPAEAAICHRTGGESNVFELITVAEASVNAHISHGDVYPEQGACPGGGAGGGGEEPPGAVPEPLTVLLFGAGLTGIGYATRRRLSRRSEKD